MRKNLKNYEARCREWNASNPVGSSVTVLLDDASLKRTTTRSEAYVCDAGYPVIFLEGVRGYYLLDRVTATQRAGGGRE